MNRMLTAVTEDGESGAVKKPRKPVLVYKCADCATERKVIDASQTPFFCVWCGSINIGYDRSE
jgi:ribosomal protein S27E